MTRDEAFELLNQMMQNQNLIRHGLAVEAIMRALCDYEKDKHPEMPEVEFDKEEWAIVGLMHDADYEVIEKDPERHTLVTEEKLRLLGVSDRIINGIKAHHSHIKPSRDNLMESAVYAADDISGLITAVALVKDKKLSSVSTESVLKKFDQRSFAAGANREQILQGIDELKIPLQDFVDLSLNAMQGISGKLGL